MLVAGLQLKHAQWQETLALSEALRASKTPCVSGAPCMRASVATLALSGARNALVIGSESTREEFSRLGSSLAVVDAEAPPGETRALYGPLVTLVDLNALYTPWHESEVYKFILVLLTTKELRSTHQSFKNKVKKYFPRDARVLVHVPVFHDEDVDAVLKTVADYLCADCAIMPNAALLASEQPTVRLERRAAAALNETMMSSMRRIIGQGVASGEHELYSAFARLRATAKRDAEVVSLVRSEAVPDRDVVVVCDGKVSLDSTRRALVRANLRAVQLVQLDALCARTLCLDVARGARAPVLVFADTPCYRIELCSAYASACQQLERRAECVMFLWVASMTDDDTIRVSPRVWETKPSPETIQEALKAALLHAGHAH
jgi:hypothetical protein